MGRRRKKSRARAVWISAGGVVVVAIIGGMFGLLSLYIKSSSTPGSTRRALAEAASSTATGASETRQGPSDQVAGNVGLSQPAAHDDRYQSRPTAIEIRDEIRKGSPLQQAQLQEAYAGLRVSWRLKLFRVDPYPDASSRVSVWLSDPESSTYLVLCLAWLPDYPILKTLSQDAPADVRGEIREIDQSVAELDNCQFTF